MKAITDLFGNQVVVEEPEAIIERLREQGKTYKFIASYLNIHDVKNSRNVDWTAQTVKRRHRRAQGLPG